MRAWRHSKPSRPAMQAMVSEVRYFASMDNQAVIRLSQTMGLEDDPVMANRAILELCGLDGNLTDRPRRVRSSRQVQELVAP